MFEDVVSLIVNNYVEEVEVTAKGETYGWVLPGGGEPFAMLTVNQVWAKKCVD